MSRIEQVLTVSKEMIKKEDYENYSKLNQSLHMEIWTAAGNEKLKKMLSELWSGLSLGVKMTEAEVTMIPQTWVTLDNEEDIKNIQKTLDLLEDDDDVQEVYHNWEEA